MHVEVESDCSREPSQGRRLRTGLTIAAVSFLILGALANQVSLATPEMSETVPLLWFALGCFLVSSACLLRLGLGAGPLSFALCILAGVLTFDQVLSAIVRLSN